MKTTMNVRTKTNLMIGSLLLAGLLSGACSREEAPQLPPAATPGVPPVVSVRLADYHQSGSSLAGENELTDLGACLFEEGVLTRIYEAPDPAGGSWNLELDSYGGTLYLVANVAGQIDLYEALEQRMTETEWQQRTVSVVGERPQHFFSGRVNLEEAAATPGQLSATLTRGVARFDLRIRAAGVAEVRSITLTNAARSAYLFPVSESLSPADVSLGDASVRFDAPLTADTPGVLYLFEQENHDLEVRIEARIDGREKTLTGRFEGGVERNRIYTLTLTKDTIDIQLDLSIDEWQPGSDTELVP